MQRRSARHGGTRKYYSEDALEGIEGFQDAEPVLPTNGRNSDDGSGEEFQAASAHSEEDELTSGTEDDVPASVTDDNSNNVEDTTNENPVHQPRTIQNKRLQSSRKFQASRKGYPIGSLVSSLVDEGQAYARGIPDTGKLHANSKEARWLLYFGPESRDQVPIFLARKHWANDHTLPSKTANNDGQGGFHRSFHLQTSENAVNWESSCRWLSVETIRHVSELQVERELEEDGKSTFLLERGPETYRAFVMGSLKNQMIFGLDVYQQIRLNNAWTLTATSDTTAELKNGFLLNLGSRINCLDWAPNRDDSTQFIAISVPQTLSRERIDSPRHSPPAFTPQPCKSAIQVWKLMATLDGRIDTRIIPQQALRVCTDWGDAKQLKWCPAPASHAIPNNNDLDGLLAGVWGDGNVRIVRVTIPRNTQTTTRSVYIERAAFSACPPNTICTCLTWLDGRRVAAGCANGAIVVWDISQSLQSPTRNSIPVIYSSVSSSYILSIAACSPSRPNFIATTSMAGYTTLTDISNPGQPVFSNVSTTQSLRMRIIQPLLAWHDFAQVVLQVDDNYTLRGSAIRRFFTTIGLGRYQSNGTAIAVSPVHPFVLVGTASGEVVSSNPIPRVMDGKWMIAQQIWFSHEWRRPTTEELSAEKDSLDTRKGPGAHYEQVGSNGLSRIVDGYKAGLVALLSEPGSNSNKGEDGLATTIYEEKSAITVLAWNPNLHVGGWAAAGCGDGLLRIEDLAC